jgi:hypothetical protein
MKNSHDVWTEIRAYRERRWAENTAQVIKPFFDRMDYHE